MEVGRTESPWLFLWEFGPVLSFFLNVRLYIIFHKIPQSSLFIYYLLFFKVSLFAKFSVYPTEGIFEVWN